MKRGKRYSAIIFDLDGTLIGSSSYHVQAFKKLYSLRGIHIDINDVRNMMGLPAEEILKFLNGKYNLNDKIKKMRKQRRRYFFQIIKGKDIVFRGARKTIEDLKKNYKVAIVTGSSRKTYRRTLERKFRRLFDEVVCVDEVKNPKPSPDELFVATRKMKVNPNDCLMVGDTIYDQIAAKKAGMDSVGVLTGFTPGKDLKKAGAKKVLKNVNGLRRIL